MKIEKFIEKAKQVHEDSYDYSQTLDINPGYKVDIICKIHGVFTQIIGNHLKGSGCLKCRSQKIAKVITKSTDSFISDSIKIHGNLYNYSNVNYVKSNIRVGIICNIHGEFKQKPSHHLNGHGCSLCGFKTQSSKRTKTTEEFIKDATNIHGNLYDYSLVNYIHGNEPIKIICSKHGIFDQIPYKHLFRGCPRCKSSKGEEFIRSYLKENNIEFEEQKRFDGCKSKRTLPFDFYIESKNIVIEFHGEQHYKPQKFFGGKEAYNKLVIRDKIKKEFCIQNNISYIELNKENIDKLYEL